MIVRSLKEAEKWFLRNASGSVTCRRPDGAEQECISYLEAAKFYAEE